MIIGIISTIFSSLGIYGFFCGNMLLLYLGFLSVIIEHIVGIYTGQEKSLGTVWIAILISFGMMANGINWLQAISVCLCFEGTICFVLGLLLMLFVGKNSQNFENSTNNPEQTITELMKQSGLSKDICTDIYQILITFMQDKDLAYKKIEESLIPDLVAENNFGNVGIAFGMLINEKGLTEAESIKYSETVMQEMVKINNIEK